MKRLLVVGLCLCAVNGFSIFPLAVQPSSVEVTTESAEVATDVVFINFPTSGAPIEVVETASDPSTDSTTPWESTTDSTSLSNAEITTEEDLASKSLIGSPNNSTSQAESKTNSASASESTTSSTSLSDSASLSNSNLTSPVETTSEPEASTLLNSSSASITDALTSTSPPNDNTSKTILDSAVGPTTPSTADNNESSTDLPSSSDSATESFIFVETTTEDLSFLSLDLLPPKTEYRSNEPDPRYDY